MAVEGQFWFVTEGILDDAQLSYVNDDSNVRTVVVDNAPTTDLISGFPADVVLDTAAGLYYVLTGGKDGVNAKLLVGDIGSAAAPTVAFTFDPTYAGTENNLTFGLHIDPINERLYVGFADFTNFPAAADQGIRQFNYDPATGAVTDAGLIYSQAEAGIGASAPGATPIFSPRDFDADYGRGVMYVSSNAFGDGYETNALVRLDLADLAAPAVSLVNPALFPLDGDSSDFTTLNGIIQDVEVDADSDRVYFTTHAEDVPDPVGEDAIWRVDGASTANGATPVKLTLSSGAFAASYTTTDFYPGDIVLDEVNNVLYVESENSNVDGVFTDVILKFQLNAAGTTATLLDVIDVGFSQTGNIQGMTFDRLAELGTLSGTAADAVEQAPAINLLLADPTITDFESDHLAGATVTATGFAGSGDKLSVAGATGLIAGTNITAVVTTVGADTILTLSGYDTLANYQTVLGDVQFAAAAGGAATTTRTVTWQVNDGAAGDPSGTLNGATTNVRTTTITIQDVNDPPTIGGLTGDDATFAEGAAAPVALDVGADAVVADIDSAQFDGGTLTVEITSGRVTAEDLLGIDVGGGVTLAGADVTVGGQVIATVAGGTGDDPLVFTFTDQATPARVTTLIQAITYDNALAATPTLGVRGLTWTLTDGDGGTESVSVTSQVEVAAVNNPPEGADSTITVDEGDAHVFTVADFGFTDTADTPANALKSVVITSLPTDGTLTLNGAPVLTNAEIDIADITAGDRVFTPDPNDSGVGYATLGFQVRDDGGTTDGGVDLDPTPNTLTFDVVAVNDAPVNTVPVGPVMVTEDSMAFITGLSVADEDAGTSPITVTLSVGHGTLEVLDETGVTVTGDLSASVQIVGSQSQINTALSGNNLRYAPTADFFTQGLTTESLTIVTDDGGATGKGGALTDTDSLSITVTGAPDAPTISDLGPNSDATYVEGGVAVAIDADATISDIDLDPLSSGDGDYDGTTLTVQRAGGANAQDVFDLAGGYSIVGGVLTDGVNDFGTVTNAGGVLTITFVENGATVTSAVANAVLRAITYANSSDAPPASVNLAYEFDDGSVGPTATGATTVAITAANNAPTATNFGPAVTVLEQQAVVIDADAVFSDPELAALADYKGASVTIQRQGGADAEDVFAFKVTGADYDVTGGVITEVLNGRGAFATYTNTGGALTITFTGQDTKVFEPLMNDLLHHITYSNTSDEPPASVVLDLTFNDGNAGAQGAGGDLEVTASQTVNITSVNDAPSGADGSATFVEDTVYTLTVADFGFTDIDNDAFLAVEIVDLPTVGTLALNNVAVIAGQTVSQADIAAGLLRYTPPADVNGLGLANFTFQVQDDGGVNDGGVDTDLTPNIFIFDVTPDSLPPSGADVTRAIDEDQAYALKRADFGFSDPDNTPPDAFAGVIIDTLPAAGTLRLDGVAVSAGQEVSVADLDAGRLVYTPPANLSGEGLASLDFQVRDDGEAGLNLDLTANTLTFDVASINDAPAHDAPLVLTTQEDVPVLLTGLRVYDIDAGPNDQLTTTLTAARGTLGEGGGASLTITGTLAMINAVLAEGVIYTPPAEYSGRTSLTISTNDGGATGGGGVGVGTSTVRIEVADVADAPIVTLAGGATLVEGLDPVAVDPGLTVTDADSATLASARVAITDGFAPDQDVLGFTASAATGDIAAAYDATTGVLTLTSAGGHATLAQWQAALRGVTYDFTTASATGDARVVTFTVNDGENDSAPASQVLHLDGLGSLNLLEQAFEAILRIDPHAADLNPPTALEAARLADLADAVDDGDLSLEDAFETIAGFADDTTSVATLTYAFFTGETPTEAGYGYLVHGPANPNDLSDPYYAQFNLVNRYINFAVNLGAAGEGKADFEAAYGDLTLAEAMRTAYAEIFGAAPAAGKIDAILAADVGGMTRAEYLEVYGRDGADGLATKAAGVGFLLATAVLDGLGPYDSANDNFLADLADGHALFHVDLLDAYGQPVQTVGQAGAQGLLDAGGF